MYRNPGKGRHHVTSDELRERLHLEKDGAGRHFAAGVNDLCLNLGEVVCAEGETLDALFRLKQGKVGAFVEQSASDGEDGAICSFGTCLAETEQADTLLGYSGIPGNVRTATLRAMTNSTILERLPLGKAGVSRFICQDWKVGLELCRSMALRFRELSVQARRVSAVLPTLQRTRDSLAVAFVSFVDRAETLAKKYDRPKVLQEIASAREGEIYNFGLARRQELHHLHAAFQQGLANHSARRLEIKPGVAVDYGADIGQALTLVLEGTMEVWVEDRHVAQFTAGHFAGDVAVLLKEAPRRSVLLKASEPVSLACLDPVPFTELSANYPNLLVALAMHLGIRLEMLNRVVCAPQQGLEVLLSFIGGGENSCAEAFTQFALLLTDSTPALRNLRELAVGLAGRALAVREDLTLSCRELLTLCGEVWRDDEKDEER